MVNRRIFVPMKPFILGLFPFLALVACHSAQKATYTTDQLVPTENALLWKISGNGLKKPSYLYGTIHMIPKSDFKLSNQALQALDASDYIAFEIDMKEMTNLRAQLSLLSKSMMSGGETLRDLLSEDDYAFVKKELEQSGVPMGMAERLKPMFTSSLLTGNDDEGVSERNNNVTSVEMELWRVAKKRKMPSAGLETAAYQMSVFDSIPYDVQARMLVETLRSTDNGDDAFSDMVEMYKNQDINAMQRSIKDESAGFSEYEDLLLSRRNKNWIPIMRDIMKRQPTFFAVGAGHLGGEEGVIALLRQAGFRVDAVL